VKFFSSVETRSLRKEASAIGRAEVRFDAFAKVTGKEKYASDLFPANFLWLGVKRSGQRHAWIRNIDITAAAKTPGILRILTHRDVKGSNRVGVPDFDEPVLCDEKVRHPGDAVALVLADSQDAITRAMPLIQVDYESLQPVEDPEMAMLAGSPLVHEKAPYGNVLLSGQIVNGAGAGALGECDFVARGEFAFPCQEHAYLETECGVAWTEPDGSLVIVASTQTPFRDRFEIASSLGLKPDQVRVIAPQLGGGFGGKDGITVQALLGLAALHSDGRPVKVVNSREESFVSSTKRHSVQIRYEVGCRKDGALNALSCRLLFDTGPYNCLGTAVLALAMEHAGGVYRIPNAFIEGFLVYTNNPIGGAFRGFGVPQVTAALEQLIDELAHRTGLEPLEFRLRNALTKGDRNACGVHLTESVAITSCLETIRRHELWKERKRWIAEAPRYKRRGVGLACASHGMGYGPVVPDHAAAKIELMPNGRITVYAGVADMGQGNAATFLQIAGALLNQRLDSLNVVLPDTSRTLPSGSSSASRTTFTYGNALISAAETLRDRILQRTLLLAKMTLFREIAPGDLALLPEGVRHLASGRMFPLGAIAQAMDVSERCCTFSYTAPTASEKAGSNEELRKWGLPHRIFSFAAQLALVEVDELTGETTICRYLSSTDAGRILNPQTYEQQVQGGIVQGLGYALMEEFKQKNGETQTRNFATYLVPTALDAPDMTSIPVEQDEKLGPFGMKGVGEIVIDPVYAAVANAVADAIQARITRGPMTPERVLSAFASGSCE
jgi:CO/xanthine dehydrogenase Mo-binding subunit